MKRYADAVAVTTFEKVQLKAMKNGGESAMRKSRLIVLSASLVAAVAGFVILMGCESDPSTDVPAVGDYTGEAHVNDPQYLSVTPAGPVAITYLGQQIVFTVGNGDSPYTWSVANDGGTVTPPQEDARQAVFTCVKLVPNTVFVLDKDGRAGSVAITPSGLLAISPKSVNVTNMWGRTIEFVATGGVQPYSWNASTPSLGDITSTSGSANENAVYTVGGPGVFGNNTITVTDAAGTYTEATVNESY